VDRPWLIFDGDCGFCTAAARWITRHWVGPGGAVPWQELGRERLAAVGLTEADVAAAAYWVEADGTTRRGHLAVAAALRASDRWRRAAGSALLLPPLSWLGRPGYWLVARYRYRLPGSTPACRVAPGERPPRSIS
jgi:predicted DCC family thiol-disulfide oxidoreductase YuxK